MLLILACMFAAAAAAPITYDQRQDGESNEHFDFKNMAMFIAIPNKFSVPMDLLADILKSKPKGREAAQDRVYVQVMEAFVEPSTPHRVEIGTKGLEPSLESDRLPSDIEPQPERQEQKLLGAIEQCGPDRERDPVSLICIPMRSQVMPKETPEVVLPSP